MLCGVIYTFRYVFVYERRILKFSITSCRTLPSEKHYLIFYKLKSYNEPFICTSWIVFRRVVNEYYSENNTLTDQSSRYKWHTMVCRWVVRFSEHRCVALRRNEIIYSTSAMCEIPKSFCMYDRVMASTPVMLVGGRELVHVDAQKQVITSYIVWIIVHKKSRRRQARDTTIIQHWPSGSSTKLHL